jgi:hypothetical protein
VKSLSWCGTVAAGNNEKPCTGGPSWPALAWHLKSSFLRRVMSALLHYSNNRRSRTVEGESEEWVLNGMRLMSS